MKDKVWVYDIEQLKNFHSMTAYCPYTETIKTFVIHNEVNHLEEYVSFLLNDCNIMIGYNNINYDYPLLHFILSNYKKWRFYPPYRINQLLYEQSQKIIESEYSSIPEKNVKIKQIDLYRIWHFDNKNRRTSLKHIQIAMNWSNVQDMPIPHYHIVENSEVEDILKYNLNDVLSTWEFYKKSKEQVSMRIALSKEYNLSLMNANAPKIGAEIFASIISNEMNISVSQLKEMRTKRDEIVFSDLIFPYIKFENKEFQALLEFLKSCRIEGSVLKGFFTDISLNKVKNLLPYFNRNLIDKKKSTVDNLHIIFEGFEYDFGVGGIHGCISPGIYESCDKFIIVDIDVSSFYPNLAIRNKFYPLHLGEKFCYIYERVYDKRSIAKKKCKIDPKDVSAKAVNEGLKLALNGSYAKSNEETSFFYDPAYTVATTVNGQLLLTMLAEKVIMNTESTLLQINTDGLTVKINRDHYEKLMQICKEWEILTGLELEYVNYKKMIIRDVNNYIGVYENNKTKLKGDFEINKDWHKDHSMKIVPKALEAYYVHGIPIEETIMNSTDIYDFTLSMKVTKGWTAIHRKIVNREYVETRLQKNNRYLITNKGGTLMKIHDDSRESNVEKDFNTTVFNKHYNCEEFSCYDINYNYYVREAYKIINVISNNNQLTLF